jgi:hypothetical protein
MDAKAAREITHLYRINLHGQMHVARGRERDSMVWMIRGFRAELMAMERLEEIILGNVRRDGDVDG